MKMNATFNVYLMSGLLTAATVFADDKPSKTSSSTKAVDLQRDGRANGPTADDQKNDKSDLELTRQIRKSIMADKSLSTAAHNVKIIAMDGNVTLRGRVQSQQEKDALGSKATEIAGSGKVANELQFGNMSAKPKNPDK
jgi:hyperosmotically inducible protein